MINDWGLVVSFTAERQKDGNGRRRVEGGMVGSDMRNSVSVGKKSAFSTYGPQRT